MVSELSDSLQVTAKAPEPGAAESVSEQGLPGSKTCLDAVLCSLL